MTRLDFQLSLKFGKLGESILQQWQLKQDNDLSQYSIRVQYKYLEVREGFVDLRFPSGFN